MLPESAEAQDEEEEEEKVLEKFGTDVTEKAREGVYDPMIGPGRCDRTADPDPFQEDQE